MRDTPDADCWDQTLTHHAVLECGADMMTFGEKYTDDGSHDTQLVDQTSSD